MSEPGSPNQLNADSINAEFQKILDDTRTRKANIEATLSSIEESLDEDTKKANTALAEAETLKSEITNARTALETDRSAITSILESARQTQNEIDASKTAAATAKGAIETLQQTATSEQAAVAQAKGEVESLAATARQLSEKLSTDHNEISKEISDLKTQASALKNVSEDIASVKSKSEVDASSIKTYLDEVEQTKERFQNLNSETGSQYDTLTKKQTELEAKIAEINTAHEQISSLRRTLLETSDEKKSVQDEVIELRAQIDEILAGVRTHKDESTRSIDTFFSTTSKEVATQRAELMESFKKLYDSLRSEILRLLPSAGAAGLAWTYFYAKARYAPTPVRHDVSATDEKIGFWNRVFGYNPWAWVSTLFFYFLFMGPLVLLAKGTWDLVQQIEFGHMAIPDIRLIALRFLVAVPLATLSAFGFASLRLNRKLYEQYNHKQRVMELYMSFKKEIETNGDDEQKKKLLTIMLDSVAEKAWRIDSPDADEVGDGSLLNLEKLTDLLGRLGVKMGG